MITESRMWLMFRHLSDCQVRDCSICASIRRLLGSDDVE